MIVGIILSAGESKRMGTPKQLLPWGESIVLQRIIDVVAASKLSRIELILGHRADEIARRLTLPAKASLLLNEAYREGMDSSVKCGIRNAPAEAEAFMLLLGDQPFVEEAVIDHLIDAHRAGGRGITIPVYNGKGGHPVIFSSRYRTELLAIGEGGAREVVKRHAEDVFEMPVDSANVLADMDTPQDYEKVKAQAKKTSR